MSNIQFATGAVEHTLNDAATVVFNPTDAAFGERVFRLFDEMDALNQTCNEAIRAADTDEETFRVYSEADNAIREKLDRVFGKPICADVFGEMSVLALADGLPLWANLMLAVIDEMDGAFTREKKARNPRLQKYVAKYEKRSKK